LSIQLVKLSAAPLLKISQSKKTVIDLKTTEGPCHEIGKRSVSDQPHSPAYCFRARRGTAL